MSQRVLLHDGAVPKLSSTVLVILLVFALRLAGSAAADLAYVLLAAWTFRGPRQILMALFLSWLCTFVNPGFTTPPSMLFIDRYIVLFSAFVSLLFHTANREKGMLSKISLLTIFVGLLIFIHTLLVSPQPVVSLLKLVSWQVTLIVSFEVWRIMSLKERIILERFIYRGLLWILFLSVPLMFFSVGRFRNGTGFQGLLNHPQALGIVLAILIGWTIAKLLSQRTINIKLMLVCGTSIAVLMQTEARTAGVAALLAVVVSIVATRFYSKIPIRRLIPIAFNIKFILFGLLVLIAGILFSNSIIDTGAYFLTKSGRSAGTNLVDIYDASRGTLIERMLENIKLRPFSGIGFGIASEPEMMQVARDPFFGLPISAPVEKGVVPIMMVEEFGIPLAVVLTIYFCYLVRRAAVRGIVPLTVILVALLINMGEAIIFSAGGMGLLLILIIGWSVTTTSKRDN